MLRATAIVFTQEEHTSVILDQMLSPENMYVQVVCEPGRLNFYI